MTERLYSTAKAGELLSLHQRDVLRLIGDGRLRAKHQVVRGKGKRPRYVVPASAIDEYINHLPDAKPTATQPAAVAADEVDAPQPRRRQRREHDGLAAEIAAATRYV